MKAVVARCAGLAAFLCANPNVSAHAQDAGRIVLTPGPVQQAEARDGCTIPVAVDPVDLPLSNLAVSARAFDPDGSPLGSAGFRLEDPMPVIGEVFPDQTLRFDEAACEQMHWVAVEVATCTVETGDLFACGELIEIADTGGLPEFVVDAP